jgi:hypothetical protein
MRGVCIFLLIATVAAGLWFLLVLYVAPLGTADGFYGSYREHLAAEIGRERADRLTNEVSHQMYGLMREVVLLIGVPLSITNAAWAIFGLRMVRRRGVAPDPPEPE